MAEHLKKILGDMLYLVDTDDSMEFLPSPDELQGKILVKAKRKSVKSVIVPPPPVLKETSPSSEKEIDFVPDGDTTSIPGVDDGLLHPKSHGWAGPPKVNIYSCSFNNLLSPCPYCGTYFVRKGNHAVFLIPFTERINDPELYIKFSNSQIIRSF